MFTVPNAFATEQAVAILRHCSVCQGQATQVKLDYSLKHQSMTSSYLTTYTIITGAMQELAMKLDLAGASRNPVPLLAPAKSSFIASSCVAPVNGACCQSRTGHTLSRNPVPHLPEVTSG